MIKVLFANIFQGMIFSEKNSKRESLFTSWSPSKYLEYFKSYNPDICCFAEMTMDDEQGNSWVVDKMSKELELPYYKNLATEKSWIIEGKYYGLSILSKYPIESYEEIKLQNPKLEVIRPNGEHWLMDDKSIQKAILNINGKSINLFNLHGFPVHHFNRRINEVEFKPIRQEISNILLDSNYPTIITGDFSNDGIKIEDVFYELFENDKLRRTVFSNSENIDIHSNQVDHILVSKHFEIKNPIANKIYSDHLCLVVSLSFK